MQEPDTVKALRLYRQQGLNSLPLCPAKGHDNLPEWHRRFCRNPGKVPVGYWEAFTKERMPDNKFEGWILACLRSGAEPNVGLIMGPCSNIVSLDADGPEAVEWVEAELRGRTDTARFTTGRGVRYVYSTASTGEVPASAVLRPGVEVLSGGRQSVAPPSLHPNGKRYSWVTGDRRTWQRYLKSWPFGDSLAKQTRPRDAVTADRVIRSGERNQALFKIACSIRRHGANYDVLVECLESLNAMCVQPLEVRELQTIAKSAVSYKPKY